MQPLTLKKTTLTFLSKLNLDERGRSVYEEARLYNKILELRNLIEELTDTIVDLKKENTDLKEQLTNQQTIKQEIKS